MNTNIPEKFRKMFSKEEANAPFTVEFSKPKVVKEIPKQQIKLSKIEITSITDSSVDKKVTAYVKGLPRTIVLWEGASYDAIGQWQDSDVTARIKEIYK